MGLLERDKNASRAWTGNLPVTSRYTFGLAGERFFRTLKEEGRILGAACARCGRVYVPATTFCERCLAKLDEWVDVGLVGTLHSYTLLFVGYDGEPLEEPEAVGFVSLGDGGILHCLDEVDLTDLEIGMLMQAVLKPPQERVGSICDIAYFRPVSH